MCSKQNHGLALAALFLCAAVNASAQSAPTATAGNLPFAIGAGFSGYNPDFGHGHLLGGTLWIDYFPNRLPRILDGFGLEAEARDLNYGRSSTQSPNLREDAVEGGLIYSLRLFHRFRPYGKFSEGYGNTDYETGPTSRHHDSRTIIGGGGGVEFWAFKGISVRADYEYQSWPDFFKHLKTSPAPVPPAGRLNPQGVTLGAVYHFSHPRFH